MIIDFNGSYPNVGIYKLWW